MFSDGREHDLFNGHALALVALATCCEPTLLRARACVIAETHARAHTQRELMFAPPLRHLDPYESGGSIREAPGVEHAHCFGIHGLNDPQEYRRVRRHQLADGQGNDVVEGLALVVLASPLAVATMGPGMERPRRIDVSDAEMPPR